MGASLIAAGAITSIIGNLNVNLLTSPRIPFAMSLQGELPQKLAAVHQAFSHAPHLDTADRVLWSWLLTLSSSLIYALTVSTIARLLAYAATCAALPRLRYQKERSAGHVCLARGDSDQHLAIFFRLAAIEQHLNRSSRFGDRSCRGICGLCALPAIQKICFCFRMITWIRAESFSC